MEGIVRDLLGDTVYLSFEQFVVKAAEKGGTFAWHQDSAYVTHAAPAVPDLLVYPGRRRRKRTARSPSCPTTGPGRAGCCRTPNWKTTSIWSATGATIPANSVIAPAGSIAIFSSYVLHRSGSNTTPRQRRVYLPQYSSAPVLKEDGTPYYIAEPFLKDGRNVAHR